MTHGYITPKKMSTSMYRAQGTPEKEERAA